MKEELLEPFFRKLRIRKILPWIPENSVVCDIGCGFAAHFLQGISSYIEKGYGFDQKVKSGMQKNIELYQYDLIKPLPLPDNSVDCITMLAVLEHLSHVDEIFSEIKRICRPGGRIILTTPSPKSRRLLEFLAFKLAIVSPAEISDHKHYWSLDEITTLLEKNNFSLIKVNSFCFQLNNFAVAERKPE